jgi:autotransporter-associated beta strand protein
MYRFDRRPRGRIFAAAAAAIAAAISPPSPVRANVLYWDVNGATAPNPAGGSGTWSAAGVNWWNGAAIQAYDAGTQPHDVTFGAATGTVTVSGAATARSLTFDTDAYTLTGGSVNLADVGVVSVTNPAHTAAIVSAVTGTTLTKTGAGRLALSGTNTYTGLTVLGGVASFSAGAHLGDAGSPVTIDNNATLQFTGSTAFTTPATRSFRVGHRGATLDVTNTSGSGLTIAGVLAGTGPLVKTGGGTLRLDSAQHVFAGGITINGGTFRFNSNNEAGPQALRMNRVTFGAPGTTLSLGGSGGSTTGEGSELRTGEWNSAVVGAGSVVAATTLTDTTIGAHGHDLMIVALADGSFAGTVSNLITSNGGAAGPNSTHGELEVRGIATQTLSGTTNVNNVVSVAHGAGLALAGNAAMTGVGVSLRLKGGNFTLDNAATNSANRLNDAAIIDSRGGGTFAFVGNSAGSAETIGQLQLGDLTAARSGAAKVRVTHNAVAAAATVLTFAGLQRDSGRATLDFSARDGVGGPLSLGQSSNNPRVLFTSAPAMAPGSGLLSGNGVGWATVNGSDFATYDASGIEPVVTTAFASAGSTGNALLSSTASISTMKSVASLKIAPAAAGQTLDLSGSGDLDTSAIMLAGGNDFAIHNTGAGTGSLAGSNARYVYVQQATLTVGTKVIGSGALVKSGGGTLVLTGANTFTGPITLNEGFLRATNGVSLGTGTLEMRGGVIEIAGGGTFNRHLDQGQGSTGTPGLISWNAVFGLGQTSNEDRGGGGFAAVGANVVVDLNGLGATDVNWEEPSFLPSGMALVLGSPNANARVDLVDNYGFGLGVDSYNTREFRVLDNPASTADVARVSGVVYSDTPANGGRLHDLLKSGDGVLELAGNNTYFGGTIIAGGTLIAAHNNALGHTTAPYVLLGNRGGNASASLLANGGVTLARDITVRAGSSGAVTLGTASSSGVATFSGTISLHRELNLSAAAGGAVQISGVLDNSAGHTLTKSDGGSVTISGAQTHGPGAVLNVAAGTLHLNSNAGGNLTLNTSSTLNFGSMQDLAALNLMSGAVATLMSDGTGTKVVKTASVSIIGTANLDLGDNKLITATSAGTANGGLYGGVQGLVQSASNGGAWDGPGITTSMPQAVAGLTSLGIATAEQAGYAGGTFGGVPVSASDVLIMYTYAGDANLDGFISGDDYAAIDFNIAVPGSDGWYNGDFNYDGIISGDDYAAIDFNIVAQGAPFATSTSVGGVNAVPEPAGTLALLAGCLALRRRARLTTDKRL